MGRSFLASVALFCAAASFGQTKSDESFVWQSRNSNLKDLAVEFGQLYGMLLDASMQGIGVETYVYQGDTDRSIESIMREERLVAGKYFPKEADLYVCQLNPSICRIMTKGSDRATKWANGPTDPLRLPTLKFEPVIVHREYAKKAVDRLRNIVVNERGGCEQYDSGCRKLLANLNRVPMKELEGRYEGPVLVPTLAYWTRVTFTDVSGTRGDSAAAPTPSAIDVQNVLEKRPNFTRRIVPEVRIKMQGNGSKAAEGTRQKIIELISHPFAHNADIPVGRLLIGVFDTWFDKTHCDIAGSVDSYVDPGDVPPGVTNQPCGTRGEASEPFDHGTHVVGLLVGSRNGKSGPGINPNARIYFVRINPQQMKSDSGDYVHHVAKRLNAIYDANRPEVVNLSFEYPFPQGLNDTFLSAMESHRTLTLFVASAGNLNQELRADGVCAVRPACGGAANLITVGALDLSDARPGLDSSNYGTAVHIAAPGKDVVSTLSGGRIGPMSGTSQAAPLVAGAASLLMLKNPRLYPETVKNRLIYTSDLFPSLYQKVQGGRLNVTRALEFEKAQLSLRGAQPLLGEVVNLGSSIALTDVDTKEPIHPKWEWIRRLKYEKEWGYYWMFWKRGGGHPLKLSLVTPQNAKQTIKFKSNQTVPALTTYTLDRISDYVAAIPPNVE